MSKRRKLVILLACGIGLAVLAWFVCRKEEPSYNGRSLSEWVILADEHPVVPDREVARAISAIGRSAVPYLVEWIQYKDPPGKVEAIMFINGLWQKLFRGYAVGDYAAARANGAMLAFRILGPQAKDAVQELSRIANGPAAASANEKEQLVSVRAIRALPWLGKEALPPLLTILTNKQNPLRNWAADAIGYMGTNAVPGIPTLLDASVGSDACAREEAPAALARITQALSYSIEYVDSNPLPLPPSLVDYLANTNPVIVARTAEILGAMRAEPSRVVPALTLSMGNPTPYVRRAAALALERFGSEAQAAVPALIQACNDGDTFVRTAARHALERIAPEFLPNAPLP